MAAGIVAGDADRELEVLADVSEGQIAGMKAHLDRAAVTVVPSESGYIFDIQIAVEGGGHTAFVQIAGGHTNVIRMERDREVLLQRDYTEGGQVEETDHTLLTVEHIVEFADCVELADVRAVLDRQIQFNTAIAEEGLRGSWGASVGKVLLEAYGDSIHNRAIHTSPLICRNRHRSSYAVIRMALDRAVKDGLIHANPAADCKCPPRNANEMKVLSREEMQRFLIQAKEEGYFELFLLELATGLRRGEVLALQWDDLDFATGELRIQRQVYRANSELVISVPKTKAALRTIVLPPSLVEVLKEYRQGVTSRWMFPSPAKEDSPLDPATCRKRLQIILKHAGCKKVSFHALRHTFVSTALESGMDVKTLSTIIGHVSAATTLDIYSHITDEMRRTAAAKIDKGIGKCQRQDGVSPEDEGLPTQTPDTRPGPAFEPYKGKRRRGGEGCLSQFGEHLWMGKYSPKWPDGKKHSRSVYAGTGEECEEKLAELIQQMKAEITEAKRFAAEGKWEEVMALAGQKKARGARGVEGGHQEKTTML